MRIQRRLVKKKKERSNHHPSYQKQVSKNTSVNNQPIGNPTHNTSFEVNDKYANPHEFINKKLNIGMLIVATGKYSGFVGSLLRCARQYFLSNHHLTFHIFTDNINIPQKVQNDVKIHHVIHREWPYPTLLRYEMFSRYKEDLLKEDYLFYSDVDMEFVNFVEEEILGERVATIHPGFFGGRGDPEGDPRSTSYISPDEHVVYFAGGFNGGSSKEFIKMSETISSNINKDLENGIIARWHDESHMNRYFLDNPPTVILNPGYCYSTCSGKHLPYPKKILALDKDHAFYRN